MAPFLMPRWRQRGVRSRRPPQPRRPLRVADQTAAQASAAESDGGTDDADDPRHRRRHCRRPTWWWWQRRQRRCLSRRRGPRWDRRRRDAPRARQRWRSRRGSMSGETSCFGAGGSRFQHLDQRRREWRRPASAGAGDGRVIIGFVIVRLPRPPRRRQPWSDH